jgi:myo-inositol-1(or 4)-monophosphatase
MASSSPEADRDLLIEAAREAGAVALSHHRRDPRAWEKGGGAGPVSEADLAANRTLAERLRGARPDYGWLSEETPDDCERLSRARTLIVDPIDGTRAFLRGEAGWCVALAVAERGRVIAAAAFFPVSGKLYAAAAGAGATKDGGPLAPSRRESLEGALALTGGPQLRAEHWPGGPPPMRRAYRASLIHRILQASDGEADAAFTFRDVWEWDAAAGALIAAEAGCIATDGVGAPLAFNSPTRRHPGLIVAPPALHAALLARRRPR